MLPEFESMNTSQLVDLLASYSQKLNRLTSELTIGNEYDECRQMIELIQVEIAKRRSFLADYDPNRFKDNNRQNSVS
jgi:hypothetical protein